MKHICKKNRAFTMLELVMVIVVLGILAAVAIPKLDRDLRQNAADNILSTIRYTQHLALIDFKHRFDNQLWQRALWQMRFSNYSGNWVYTVASNIDYNTNLDQNEAATDPLTGNYLHSTDAVQDDDESPRIFLTKKYGIDSITFNGCKGSVDTDAKHIAFDHLGRPHRGVTQNGLSNYQTYVKNMNCEITFSSPQFDSSFTIIIERETGFSYISDQNAS
jgi:prepilin-type N-terminal cleavage/methylation domain-containing protein